MRTQAFQLITILLPLFSANAQPFHHNFLQYSSTGTNSSSGADIMDVDGDGAQDILLGMEQRNDLIYIKNNSYTYTPALLFNMYEGHTYIKAIDFDDDGDEDFILGANQLGTNKIFICFNDGMYQYTPVLVGSTGGEFVEHLEIGDFDGDADNDIIYNLTGSNNGLYKIENDGGTFSTTNYGLAGPIAYFRKMDLNADNVPDVLIGYYNYSLTAYVQTALECDNAFGFISHPIDTTGGIQSAIIGNFSGDAAPDIIFGAATGATTSALWRNDGNFQFSHVQTISVPSGAHVSIPVDYDDDGDDDFFATNNISWQLQLNNNGSDNFSAVSIGDNTLGVPIAFVDMNNDGLKDIVGHSNSQVQIQKNFGSNVFKRIYTNYDEGNDQFVIADITGEGREDIVATGYTKLSFFKQSFEELVELPTNMVIGNGSYTSGTKIDRMIKYDKDYDGDIDFLCCISNDLYWFVNNDGVFSEELITGTASGSRIAVGDLNNNHQVDILIYSIGDYQRFEWNGTNYTESQITGGGGSHFVIHDYDGDNDEDILFLTYSGSNVELRALTNTGTTTFTNTYIQTVSDITSTTINAPNNKSVFNGVDIDNDNDLDLFILSPHENKLVWIQSGGGINYSPSVLISDQLNNALSMSFNDVNNVNGTDIVVANRNDDEILLFENDGNQFFNQTVIATDVNAPEVVVSVDFDHDGDIDIAYSTVIHDRIGWFENLIYDCPRTFAYDTAIVCPDDSVYFAGAYFSVPGIYYDTLVNISGCDSVRGLELANYTLASITISASGFMLSVPSGHPVYQWYLDNVPVITETNNSIDAATYGNGIYTVEIATDDGCVALSNQYTVNGVGIYTFSLSPVIIYPNPTMEFVTIDCGSIAGELVTIYSYNGELIREYKMSSNTINISLSELPHGFYFIKVQTPEQVITTKVVKK